MKRLLTILILIFTFQTPSQADDISNFQIEGLSLGDSALDFTTKEEIERKKLNGFIYPNSKKFYSVTFRDTNKLKTYDGLQFHLKADDKKYIIYDIMGQIYYEDNIEDCYKKKDEIYNELSEMFENAKKEDLGKQKHYLDPTSTVSTVNFQLKTGRVMLVCHDWGEYNATNGLGVGVESTEFRNFINNEAYK